MSSEPVDFLVVIPTFRRPKYLRDAIEGVLLQTEVSIKIIVVDDSPEGSAESVANGFGNKDIIYLRNLFPTGGWPSKVRNYGFEKAAELGIEPIFVHFLDDDDIPVEGIYSAVKLVFDKNPNIGVVFGTLVPFCDFSQNETQRELQKNQLEEVRRWRAYATVITKLYDKANNINRSLGQWLFRQHSRFSHELFLCSGGMIRYKHAKDLNGFDPNTRITEDYEFYTRAIIRFGVHFLNRPSAMYRVGNVDSLWNPLGLEGERKSEHENEFGRILKLRQLRLREEMGNDLKFYFNKIVLRLVLLLLGKTIVGKLVKSEMQENFS